jgi:hypothetical protein
MNNPDYAQPDPENPHIIPLPEHDPRPEIVHPNCARYISDFARELGGILKSKGFYRFHGEAVQVREVTVKARNGKEYQIKKLVHLSPTVFSTLIELYCRPIIPISEGKKKFKLTKSITLEMAKRTLVCLDFLSRLPEITFWTDARLPVRRGRQIVLSEPGYDQVTGIFTSPDSPIIDESLTVEDAAKEWRGLLAEFCFPKSEPDGKIQEPEKERCIAVTLAAALTPLCLTSCPKKPSARALQPVLTLKEPVKLCCSHSEWSPNSATCPLVQPRKRKRKCAKCWMPPFIMACR